MSRKTIQQRFEEFDKANPNVEVLFLRFFAEAMKAGQKRISADAVLHRVRWEVMLTTTSAGAGMPSPTTHKAFKINNDFSSRYARKLIAGRPHLAPYLEFRAIKTL